LASRQTRLRIMKWLFQVVKGDFRKFSTPFLFFFLTH
jgi:hypothetical protein